MKGDFKFTITNDNVKKALDEKDDGIRKALIAIGMNAEGYAKRSLTDQGAVDTGRLRNSVTYALDGEATAISDYTDDKGDQRGQYDGKAPAESKGNRAVYVGTNVEYGPSIESGTYKMRARPYIKPAIADHVQEYEGILKKILEGNSR